MILYLLVVSIFTLTVYGYDKFMAKSGGWRVPEKTLFLLGTAGGGFGALAGMLLFRHKIRKPVFWIINCLTSMIWVVLIYKFAG
jgi:uncharacterized membrane protein YsdA (DUF1294 family)